MPSTTRVPTAARRGALAVLVVLVAVIVGAVVNLVGGAPSAASPSSAPPAVSAPPRPTAAAPEAAPPVDGASDADGRVADGVTVFDDDVPAVSHLDAALLAAVRDAATHAADDGITFYVNSGWRSRGYQDKLLSDAVAQYGSVQEAARWVATADTSPHVQGEAIDVGRWDATSWLSTHGARYGLCQIYSNEPWHYELRPDAVTTGCPRMYADPTQDPRMRP